MGVAVTGSEEIILLDCVIAVEYLLSWNQMPPFGNFTKRGASILRFSSNETTEFLEIIVTQHTITTKLKTSI